MNSEFELRQLLNQEAILQHSLKLQTSHGKALLSVLRFPNIETQFCKWIDYNQFRQVFEITFNRSQLAIIICLRYTTGNTCTIAINMYNELVI